jgi:hypothetical protein
MQLTASWNNTFKNDNTQSTTHKQLDYHLCAIDTEHAYNSLQPTHKAIWVQTNKMRNTEHTNNSTGC